MQTPCGVLFRKYLGSVSENHLFQSTITQPVQQSSTVMIDMKDNGEMRLESGEVLLMHGVGVRRISLVISRIVMIKNITRHSLPLQFIRRRPCSTLL